MSVRPRLQRLFGADGKCLNVAIDHGFFGEFGFLTGIEDMRKAVTTVIEARPDVVQLTVGQARHLQDVPDRQKPSLALRTDTANVYGKTLPALLFAELIGEPVEQALRLDACPSRKLRPRYCGWSYVTCQRAHPWIGFALSIGPGRLITAGPTA
jgi:DhnA family fructose-bisphosphate aldolase class Ia